ncbi:hypothetical protein LJC63_02730 [Ruminococcaceae bacterium OttesenSCG-928-L11]|nr:hypothetical protein [Ruminococcaceae bacterium OttesenSCG-928-L11]
MRHSKLLIGAFLILALTLSGCGEGAKPGSTGAAASATGEAMLPEGTAPDEPEAAEETDATETATEPAEHPGMDRETVKARVGVFEGKQETPGYYTSANYVLSYTNAFAGFTFTSNGDWLIPDDIHRYVGLDNEGEYEPRHAIEIFQATKISTDANVNISIETPTERMLDMGATAREYVEYLSSVLDPNYRTASEPYEAMVAGKAYDAITVTNKVSDGGGPRSLISMCRRVDDVFVVMHITVQNDVVLDDVLAYFS